MTALLERGSVVRPLCGRDQGGMQVVLRAEGGYVLLADGRRRPIERPKRKNPRHVAATGLSLGEQAMATNRALRRALAQPGPQGPAADAAADHGRPVGTGRPPTT